MPGFILGLCFAAPAFAQTGNIQGSVVDFEGKPVAGALVSIDRQGIRQHFETRTNSKGSYVHAGLPTGQYKVTVTKDGKVVSRQARVIFGAVAQLDFDLRVMTPYDGERPYKATVTDLTVPRKAVDEFRKAFEAKDDIEKAKKHLEKAIEIAPNFEDALNNLGVIYYRMQQYTKARDLFQRAVNVNADSAAPRVNLGGALLALMEYERALAENLRAVALKPDDGLANGQAGLALFYLKRYQEAIPYLLKAKQANPFLALLPGFFLASAYEATGNTKAAVTEYQEYLKIHPDDPEIDEIQRRLIALSSS